MLTSTPIFGVDQGPTDGAIWSITLATGGAVLADDLKSLDAETEAESACSGL